MSPKTERVLRFVSERKKPVTAKVVAYQFAMARSTAATYLRTLYEFGYLNRDQVKGQIVWSKQEGVMPAEPVVEPPVERPLERQVESPRVVERPVPKAVWPTSTYQTSYPHARGYDD